MVMDDDTPFLPQEIITNILKRLPVKSLIRFQCVCKHWKNLIKTPSFVADHLHHSSHQNPSLLFQQNSRCEPLHLCSLNCEMQFRGVQNPPLIGSFPCVTIVGSSNGLLCVEIDQHGIFPPSLLLWNPAIREVRQVPRTRTLNYVEYDCTVGFGFSPVVNDYKIVRTLNYSGHAVFGVEVYSLSTGSWKEIDCGDSEDVRFFLGTVTANGAIFWYGLKRGLDEEGKDDIDLIVSFDIATEVFTLMPWPVLHCNLSSQLTVYEDKLALLSHSMIGNFPYYESSLINLWVMEEGIGTSGERRSWCKKYTSSLNPCVLYAGTIWRNEIACIVFGMFSELAGETEGKMGNDEPKAGIYMSNVTTNEFKMFAIPRHGVGDVIFNYVESLVPVGNIHID